MLNETIAKVIDGKAEAKNGVVAEENYKGKQSGKIYRIVYLEKNGKYEFHINGADAGSSPETSLDTAKRKARALADYLGGR